MADDNWNPVISHGKQKRKRDYELREERIRTEAPHRSQRNQNQNLAWYNATRSPPTDTAEEYDKSHAQRYGAEEGMVDGKHRRGNPSFPIGSERDIAHAKYSESTKQKERARKSYRGARKAHTAEIDNLSPEEKGYYEHSTGGLFPTHHANLFTRALDLADSAWK